MGYLAKLLLLWKFYIDHFLTCRTFNHFVGDYYVAPAFLDKIAVRSQWALTLRLAQGFAMQAQGQPCTCMLAWYALLSWAQTHEHANCLVLWSILATNARKVLTMPWSTFACNFSCIFHHKWSCRSTLPRTIWQTLGWLTRKSRYNVLASLCLLIRLHLLDTDQ